MIDRSIRRPKGEARREAIEADARRMLLSDGYAHVSLRKIASHLGISLGNLQYYFPTKDDLVEAVITKEIATSLAILDGISWDPDAPRSCIGKATSALLHHHASDAGRFYAIAEFLALNDDRYAKLKRAGYDHVFDYVTHLVALMAPSLEGDQPKRLAKVLVALIDGASLQVQFTDTGTPKQGIDDLASDVADAIEHLLRQWM